MLGPLDYRMQRSRLARSGEAERFSSIAGVPAVKQAPYALEANRDLIRPNLRRAPTIKPVPHALDALVLMQFVTNPLLVW